MHTIQAIYQQHAPALRRFALGLCGDAALAKDLVAETFMRAMTTSSPIESTTVLAYLCTIARRLYLKEWHRHQRHAELEDGHVDPAPGPEQRAIGAQDVATTLAALQALPEVDRSALLMRAGDEIPYEDIARTLGISTSAAKVKVFRARLKLSQLLNKES